MKRIIYLLLLIVSNASATVYTTTGVDTWDANGAPPAGWITGHTINVGHTITAAYSLQLNGANTVNITNGGTWNITDITTNLTTWAINVQSGGTFNITSTISMTGGTVTIDAGGTFVTGGSVSNVAGTTFTLNGHFGVGSAFTNEAAITGTGTLAYSTLGGSGSVAGTISLPVELIHFSVNQGESSNDLKWVTASEVNNDYFEVQSSSDGVDFFTVSVVYGQGNTSEITKYSFSDQMNNKENTYYRLKQVDFDGAFTYSNVILTGGNLKTFATINQNMNSNDFYVVSHESAQLQINVFDISGSLVSEEFVEGVEGSRFNFQVASKGLFIIQVSNGNQIILNKSIIH